MKGKSLEDQQEQEDNVLQMVEGCEEFSALLSPWEVEFIDGASHLLSRGRVLTGDQKAMLKAIWTRISV